MKDRPTKSKLTFHPDEDSFHDTNDTNPDHELTQDDVFLEMQRAEDFLVFCNDVVEQIKDFTEYHVLPIAENLDNEHIESFIEIVKNI